MTPPDIYEYRLSNAKGFEKFGALEDLLVEYMTHDGGAMRITHNKNGWHIRYKTSLKAPFTLWADAYFSSYRVAMDRFLSHALAVLRDDGQWDLQTREEFELFPWKPSLESGPVLAQPAE